MCLLPSSDDLSVISRDHTETEEENWSHKVALWPPHGHCGMHVPSPSTHTHHTHAQIIIIKIEKSCSIQGKTSLINDNLSLGLISILSPQFFFYYSTLLLWLRWTGGSEFYAKELEWSSGVDCVLTVSSIFSRGERKGGGERKGNVAGSVSPSCQFPNNHSKVYYYS